jgi:hypothetical protein
VSAQDIVKDDSRKKPIWVKPLEPKDVQAFKRGHVLRPFTTYLKKQWERFQDQKRKDYYH